MASRVRRTLEATGTERPPPALTSDLLEEIFLRVASPADLARACTACVSFRRLITDRFFLRRYRSIHPPPLLGFLCRSVFQPAEAPHPSAALARAVARAVDFSFEYLPHHTKWQDWHPHDVRDGRVLVEYNRVKIADYFVVCDPLSRRFLALPPIPDDLLGSVELQDQRIVRSGASFTPSGGVEEDTSFSVIRWLQSEIRLGLFVFSSVSGCWSVSASTNWDDLGVDNADCGLVLAACTHTSFYWKLHRRSTLLKLDVKSMQFCTIDLPPGHNWRGIKIVESGGGKIAMFSLSYGDTSIDYYTFSQNGGENSNEWHMKSTIPLPAHYTFQFFIGHPADGYIFLSCSSDEEDTTYSAFCSLEIKSFNIEKVSRTRIPCIAYPYFGFPPSMSPRRIQGYGED